MHPSKILSTLWCWFGLSSNVYSIVTVESDEPVTESGELQELHFGNLDVRVGRVSWVDVHMNDLGHFHMRVNFNNSLTLTCVSEISTYLRVEDFRNRLCIFIVNVKPLKLMGTPSEAFILTTLVDEWWLNVIDPPEGSVEGDIVYVDGLERDIFPEIDTTKSNFLELMSFMRVNEDGKLTYKDMPLNVAGKGPATTENLNNIGLRNVF